VVLWAVFSKWARENGSYFDGLQKLAMASQGENRLFFPGWKGMPDT
jgi:hypothetical protein